MMHIGIYPGSFDPVTNGHLDIVRRASSLCDKLIIAVARNQDKRSLFATEERVSMLIECCSDDINNVEVVSFDGLLVDYCRQKEVSFIVRGLRAIADFEYEHAIALMNKKLAPDVETVFLMASAEYSFVSSRMVKEVASYKGDISSLVPDCVIPRLMKRLCSV
ncbi:MAG: pantetheine-phosphate adenylyltransferase [Spirochaetes bacterium]|nr:pantetheine-phosphate adenylyltransferase [Spirochaetota bacterium]